MENSFCLKTGTHKKRVLKNKAEQLNIKAPSFLCKNNLFLVVVHFEVSNCRGTVESEPGDPFNGNYPVSGLFTGETHVWPEAWARIVRVTLADLVAATLAIAELGMLQVIGVWEARHLPIQRQGL